MHFLSIYVQILYKKLSVRCVNQYLSSGKGASIGHFVSQAYDRFVLMYVVFCILLYVHSSMICILHFKLHGYTDTHVTSLSQTFHRFVLFFKYKVVWYAYYILRYTVTQVHMWHHSLRPLIDLFYFYVQSSMIYILHFKVHGYTGTHVTSLS